MSSEKGESGEIRCSLGYSAESISDSGKYKGGTSALLWQFLSTALVPCSVLTMLTALLMPVLDLGILYVQISYTIVPADNVRCHKTELGSILTLKKNNGENLIGDWAWIITLNIFFISFTASVINI